MTQYRLMVSKTCLWAPVFVLAYHAVCAADNGYPPPPGAYHSESSALPKPTGSATVATRPGSQTASQRDSRPPMLLRDSFDSKPHSYGANNLFGSSTPPQASPTSVSDRPSRPRVDSPDAPQFSPRDYPAEQGPGYSDLHQDFRHSGRQPQPMPEYQEPQGKYHSPYPPYPAAYRGYPRSGSQYHPGQGMPGPGYQPYFAPPYAQGYPQDDRGMPPQDYYRATAPTAPDFVPQGYGASSYPSEPWPAPLAMPQPGYAPDTGLYPAATAPAGGALFRPTD